MPRRIVKKLDQRPATNMGAKPAKTNKGQRTRRVFTEEFQRDAIAMLLDEHAILVGVYGGNPQWAELSVSDPRDELTEDEQDRVTRSVGILVLTGREMLFPIDGQHRVAGIKRAVSERQDIADDEVAVIMIGHDKSAAGMDRTRRLFVTLNKHAMKVSDRDIVALDEDNGLAVIARRLIDDFALFKKEKRISFSRNVAIPDSDRSSVSSVLGVYQIVKALYPRKHPSWPSKSDIQKVRPDDGVLDEMYQYNTKYWTLLSTIVGEYKSVFGKRNVEPGSFRTGSKNHLLFRPSGQVAFAGAVECVASRGDTLQNAVRLIAKSAVFSLHEHVWSNILWDPVGKKMLKNVSPAETLLLKMAGQPARTQKAIERLEQIISNRDDE